MYLTPPLREFPLEFYNGGSALNTVMSLPDGGKSLTISAFISIPEYDGQTDGQTDGFAITISRSACIGMLTRGNITIESVRVAGVHTDTFRHTQYTSTYIHQSTY